MLIGLGEEKNPIDFECTRLKVKVTGVTCKKCKHGFHSLSSYANPIQVVQPVLSREYLRR